VLAYGLLMAWLPLLLIGVFVIYTIGPRLEAGVAEKAVASARAKADMVTQSLLGVDDHLHAVTMTFHERLLTLNADSRQVLFYDLLKTNPLLEEVYLLDPKGSAIAWVSRWRLTGVGQPEEVALKSGQKDSFITNVHRERDGRLTSMICVPVRSTGWQEIVGYLGGKVRLRGVADLALTYGGTKGGNTFIVDEEGNLVGHDDFSQVLANVDVRASQAVKDFMEGSRRTAGVSMPGPDLTAQRYVNYQGSDVLGVYAPVGQWGWAVVVEKEREEALKPVKDWMNRFYLVGFLLSLSAVGIGYFISRRITDPVEALEQGVNKVARGEWDQDLPGSGTDEVGRLVAAFNHMLKEQREKKELEERLVQTDKMATLGTVATSVAHEINNPLAVISGYSEDMLDRLREGDTEALVKDGEKYLSIICNQTKRCKTITRMWLDTARLPQRIPEPVNIPETVEAVRELLVYRAQKKGVVLKPLLMLDTDIIPVVLADRGELQQVLLNLIINAMDACSEGDTVEIQLAAAEGHSIIRIIDSGLGISEENLQRIGQSFFTTKPPGQGTGLGLHIVRELIEPWGGSLAIDSAGEGKGAVVTLRLPLHGVKEGRI
jgi:two-component system NtrC family sensor kinase